MSGLSGPISVVIAAGGEPWETEALRVLTPPATVVIKRCVDLADLLASVSTGQADVAVISSGLPGLDGDALATLARGEVAVVVVGEDRTSLAARHRLGAQQISSLPQLVRAAVAEEAPSVAAPPVPPAPDHVGTIVTVWGPRGAPGRTTIAVALAAARARTGPHRVVLADVDPFGGSVAQHLGILDEASGLLAAARLVNTGTLDATSFALTRRTVEEGLEILSGLPRADRWIEVRPGVVETLARVATEHADVVIDAGFCLEDDDDLGPGPQRHLMTREALECADEIVVVGSADAVGLARLARALVEVQSVVPGARLRVVVNRLRDSLGWTAADMIAMVEGFVRPLSVTVLPEDVVVCDRAMLEGVAVSGETDLGKGLAALAAQVYADSPAPPVVRRRWRRP